MNSSHPFGKILIPFGFGLLTLAIVGFILSPLLRYLSFLWPLLAIAIGIGLILWKFPIAKLKELIRTLEDIPFLWNAGVLLILLTLYGTALWLAYGYGAKRIHTELGVELRLAWLIVTILGSLAIPAFWILLGPANIPGDPKTVKKGFRGLAFLTLLFFGWWYHIEPNRFFSRTTPDPDQANKERGKSLFWVDDDEGKIYYADGFSPVTGKRLRPGTPEDAAKYRTVSWLSKIDTSAVTQFFKQFQGAYPSSRYPQATLPHWTALGENPSLPFCNGGEAYDYSEKTISRFEVATNPDCYSREYLVPKIWGNYRIVAVPQGMGPMWVWYEGCGEDYVEAYDHHLVDTQRCRRFRVAAVVPKVIVEQQN